MRVKVRMGVRVRVRVRVRGGSARRRCTPPGRLTDESSRIEFCLLG